MKENNKKAFTLIEIMVVIVLLIIFYLWIRSLNFNSKTNEQNLEIFSNKIVSLLENTRNDVLFWKVKYDSSNPDKFEKIFEEEILVDLTQNKIWNVTPPRREKIEKIYCNWTETINWNPNKFKIIFKNDKIYLYPENYNINNTNNTELKCWNANKFLSKLNIITELNWIKFEIEIDTVSWLIKKTKK